MRATSHILLVIAYVSVGVAIYKLVTSDGSPSAIVPILAVTTLVTAEIGFTLDQMRQVRP